ncbi:hypothetical protein DFH08DRAFT_845496 [Mycena albidolilacea]|uniref:Uncharacterized protein n=1 Tax=Mycena albidolilacea TaxID=1033008 RepID=A0AAD7AHR4_9AGAR|nr:hypothetical protein DFH08DRAFT_845496 [Mycena albidolilacea]
MQRVENTFPRLCASLHIPEAPLRESVTALLSIRERKFAQRMEIAQAWLERSGQCPLSISLYGSLPPDTVPAGYSSTSVILKTFIPFASRWYDVHTATSAALESLCVLSENDVPMLRTLDISESYQSPLPRSPRWGSSGLLRGPKISSFVVLRASSVPLNFPLRWHQLTSLSITNRFDLGPPLTSTMAAGMFSQCPRLRTCRLVINDDTDSAAVSESVLELPSLLALDIHSIGVVSEELPT